MTSEEGKDLRPAHNTDRANLASSPPVGIVSTSTKQRSIVTALRNLLRRRGVDVVRYPYFFSREGHLQRLLAQHAINMVLDVGANTGQFVEVLRGMGYRGWIASFEPVASLYRGLSAKAHGDAMWRCYQMALGDAEEERAVNVLNGSTLSSFLAPNAYCREEFQEDAALQLIETVSVSKLDSVFDDVASVAPQAKVFLKMDTQGWDLAVLRGAKRSCQQIALMQAELSIKPIYEAQPSWVEFMSAASDMGFELAGLYPVTHASSGAVIEFDGLFVRTAAASNLD